VALGFGYLLIAGKVAMSWALLWGDFTLDASCFFAYVWIGFG